MRIKSNVYVIAAVEQVDFVRPEIADLSLGSTRKHCLKVELILLLPLLLLITRSVLRKMQPLRLTALSSVNDLVLITET